jgi:hypothetical protein
MRQLMHGSTPSARPRKAATATALLGCICIALTGLVLHVSPAHASACAAQNNYTGPAGGEWNVEGNWSNKLPKTNETVCIPEGKGTITIAAGVKAEVKTLLAQSAVSVASTATLAISEKFFMEEPVKDEEHATRFTDGLTIDSGAVVSTGGAWILMSGPVVLEGEIDNTTGNVNEVVARLESGTLTGDGVLNIPFGNIAGANRARRAGLDWRPTPRFDQRPGSGRHAGDRRRLENLIRRNHHEKQRLVAGCSRREPDRQLRTAGRN